MSKVECSLRESSHLENDNTCVSFLFHPFSYISGVSNALSHGSTCT